MGPAGPTSYLGDIAHGLQGLRNVVVTLSGLWCEPEKTIVHPTCTPNARAFPNYPVSRRFQNKQAALFSKGLAESVLSFFPFTPKAVRSFKVLRFVRQGYLENVLTGLLGKIHASVDGAAPHRSVPGREVQDGREKLVGRFLSGFVAGGKWVSGCRLDRRKRGAVLSASTLYSGLNAGNVKDIPFAIAN